MQEFNHYYDNILNHIHLEARTSRGTSQAVINSLASGTYGEWARPGESDERCPICFEDVSSARRLLSHND